MDPAYIEELIAILRRTGVQEIDLQKDGLRLRIRTGGEVSLTPIPAQAEAEAPAETTELRATMAGMFYHAPEPGASPFVAVGDLVAAGQTLALLEAMKMMTPVCADAPGRVLACHVPDARAVARGDVLFTLSPADEGPVDV